MPLIALEIFLGFGVPLAWAGWELHTLRRERQRRAEREAAAERTVEGRGELPAGKSAVEPVAADDARAERDRAGRDRAERDRAGRDRAG